MSAARPAAIAPPTGDGGVLSSPRRVLPLFAVLTLAMTFPLALSWRTSLPAGSGDIWQNYWNFWWWKQCLLEGWNPLQTPLLFHPTGTDLVFHTHSPFNQVAAMPINLLFGGAAAYNFCLVLALTLSGFGMYLLVRELTSSPSAGFVAGLVFAYFPQTVEQTLEHLNLFSAQFIPLSIYYLVRWARSLRTADALAWGACVGLNALCSWHLGLKLALVALPWLAWLGWKSRSAWRLYLRGAAAGGAAALLLVLPMLVPMVVLIASGADYYTKPPVPRGIDASYLLTPAYANPLLGSWVEPRYLERAYQAAGFVCYLGFIPLGLALYGFSRSRSRTFGWLVLGGAAILLACGSPPLWDGTLLESVPLPFAWMRSAPLLANLRVANRFLLLAALALAVLAGYGWKALWPRPKWALPMVAALILLEFSWVPFPVQAVDLPPLLQRVAERPGAVLDLPFHQHNRTVPNMVAQTVHGRPIGGGYLSCYPPETIRGLEQEPVLRQLAGVPASDLRIDVARLRQLGFRTVIVHKDRVDSYRAAALRQVAPGDLLGRKRKLRLGGIPDERMAAIRAQLDAALGGAALEDDRLAIYFL